MLGSVQREASSAIGFVISLGKKFEEEGRHKVSSSLLSAVRQAMPGVDPRLCTGYACLLYFAEKVVCELNYCDFHDCYYSQLVEIADMEPIKEELQYFLHDIHPFMNALPASTTTDTPMPEEVANMMSKATEWAKHLIAGGENYKVCTFCL